MQIAEVKERAEKICDNMEPGDRRKEDADKICSCCIFGRWQCFIGRCAGNRKNDAVKKSGSFF